MGPGRVAHWLERPLGHQKGAGLIPGWGTRFSLSSPPFLSYPRGRIFFFLKAANGSCLRELGDGGLWIKGRFTFSYLLFGCFYHYCAIVKNILEKLTSPF